MRTEMVDASASAPGGEASEGVASAPKTSTTGEAESPEIGVAEKTGDEKVPPETPKGYVPMKVLDVVPTPHGNAVLLVDSAEERVIPIFVGGTEALSIQLRLDRTRYKRPLTHDLLDSLVDKLGGRVFKVQVDDIRSNVFIGSVHVEQGGKTITLDARPSDAIALSLGRLVPIFVAKKVIDTSSLRMRDLKSGREDNAFDLPEGHQEPMAL